MSQICKICHWRPSTILELAGRLLLRSLEQRQIEGWSWWQNWPILCALQLCCWVEDLNSNGLGSRPASMKMYKSRRNGRKSPKNRKLHLKCGGLRWTQWSKILFSPFLYIGMTIEFTWGWPKSWFFSFCSPPYLKTTETWKFWSQNRKIIFPPCLYVGMTSKFTWGLKIHIWFPPLL